MDQEHPAKRASRLGRARERLRTAWRRPGAGFRLVTTSLAVALMLGTTIGILAPMLANWKTFGFHDWDVETAFRYITVVSLKKYGEPPWWHPWLCGGYPAFGHFEGATNFISPYLPIYLLTDIRTAIRLEVVGGALVGLTGTYLLARRFTRSTALATFLAIVYVLNGRWALQAAVGHTWHLKYGWTPWVFYFFDRAQDRGKLHHALYAGAVLALMVYLGAIYPLPQTALALLVYALFLAVFTRRLRPIVTTAIAGVTSVGFAAPKLFAVLATLHRDPRLIPSTETIGLKQLVVMLTDSHQSYTSRPVSVPAYGWHEWGIYIGTFAMVCLIAGVIFAHNRREQAFKIVGLGYLLCGLGAFNKEAPWALLHKLPIFSSQHVPSRFLYPMILFLGLAFVGWAAGFVDRRIVRRPWLDLLLLLPVAYVAADIAQVSHRPFAQAFWMEKPDHIAAAKMFEQHEAPATQYKVRDWAPPILLSMFANKGVIRCYGLDPRFHGIGAIAVESHDYRGRAYVVQGSGHAEVTKWSPNRVTVRVTGATPGALLVYNMNYFPSWSANGKPALNYDNAVATRLDAANEVVEFSYFPRTLKYSIPLFLLTLGAAIGVPFAWRRRERQRAARPPVSETGAAPPDPEAGAGAGAGAGESASASASASAGESASASAGAGESDGGSEPDG
jgi:6-pyruvoyl-tetrahydropterin synthase related domain